jgi:DNA-binding transcriptional ArsR family regulator
MLDIEACSTLLNAMANASRLMMLVLLSENELSVGELCDAVGLEQSAVSQQICVGSERAAW